MAGGLVVVLVTLVVWLSSGRDPGRDKLESLDRLRGTVIAARERAVKAEAPALAADSLSKAEASQAEGERLSTARDLAGASQAYQAAVERYGEAEKQAQTKLEQRTAADAARTKMAAERQRAAPDAVDFARAVELERQGSAMYARLSFAEAATSFRSAGELFAKALPPPPPAPAPVTVPASVAPAPADPRAQIRALLDSYVRAAETKDVELLRRIRPGLSEDELRRVRASNEIKRSHKVDLRVYEITVNGDEAQAQGRREDVVMLSSGQRLQTETRFTYTLKRGPRGWVISEIRESADRAPSETRPAPTRRPEAVTR